MSTPAPHPRKKTTPTVNPVKKLIGALTQRLHHIVAVIDDALRSDNLKDRIWAVEQLLKRLKLDSFTNATAPEKTAKTKPPPTEKELAKLPADELEHRLLELLSPKNNGGN